MAISNTYTSRKNLGRMLSAWVLAFALLQMPSLASAKASKAKDKTAQVQKQKKTATNKQKAKAAKQAKLDKKSDKKSTKLARAAEKKGKHARVAERAAAKPHISERAQGELDVARERIASVHAERQAQMREVRRAQLALAGYSPNLGADEDETWGGLENSNAASWGKRSGLQYTADPLGLSASVAYLVDANTGEVIYSKNENAVLPIASITKLMTAVVIAEAQLPMDEAITITDDDVDRLKNSSSRLKVGTTLSRGQMLLLALMSSENRAAHSLARTFPGGSYNFVRYMNQKAHELGMRSTHYVDPTGLSSENQSSAKDLAILAAYAAKDATLRSYSTSPEYAFDGLDGRLQQYRNSNALVRGGAWSIDLQKTGYIREAGRCMVLQTQMAGRSVVMVLLDAVGSAGRRNDAERLREWIEGGSVGLYAAGSNNSANSPAVSGAGGYVQAAHTSSAGTGNIMRALRGGM